ncbi:hypothetical protein ACTMU2_35230 [Cupriavidus basilensis]
MRAVNGRSCRTTGCCRRTTSCRRRIIAKAIATRLDKFELPVDVRARIAARLAIIEGHSDAGAGARHA